MARGDSLGRCGLCRRALIRPVQTVTAQGCLYHLACWREQRPTTKRATVRAAEPVPSLASLLDALYRPETPLPRSQTVATLLTVPDLPPWICGRLMCSPSQAT